MTWCWHYKDRCGSVMMRNDKLIIGVDLIGTTACRVWSLFCFVLLLFITHPHSMCQTRLSTNIIINTDHRHRRRHRHRCRYYHHRRHYSYRYHYHHHYYYCCCSCYVLLYYHYHRHYHYIVVSVSIFTVEVSSVAGVGRTHETSIRHFFRLKITGDTCDFC